MLPDFPRLIATTRNGPIGYRQSGSPDGHALVLLHGIGSASGSWVHQLQRFGNHFRVIAWDAPGYGQSMHLNGDDPDAGDYADALQGLLDALDVKGCLLVAQSLGALVACRWAATRPHALSGLVLISPANGYGRASVALREARLQARLQAMDELGPQGLAEARAHNLLSAQAAPEALALVRENMAALDRRGHAQAAHLLAGGSAIDDAHRYAGPTLVLCGSEDRVTPPADCELVAKAFAQAEFRVLPGPGHASYVESPDQVNQAISEFAHRLGLC